MILLLYGVLDGFKNVKISSQQCNMALYKASKAKSLIYRCKVKLVVFSLEFGINLFFVKTTTEHRILQKCDIRLRH